MVWVFARDRRPWPWAHFASRDKNCPVRRRSRLVKSTRRADPVFNCCRQRELRFFFETIAQTAFKILQKKWCKRWISSEYRELQNCSSRAIHYNNWIIYSINWLPNDIWRGTKAPYAYLGTETHFVQLQHFAMICSQKREENGN